MDQNRQIGSTYTMNWQKIISPIIIITFAAVMRLLPHPANMAPIAAMALFGGVYLNKRYALIMPLLAMGISDIFLGFHDTIVFVYGSFLLTGLIGLLVRKHKSVQTIALATLISSVLFFLITNFGVWLMGMLYPKTLSGLADAYMMGLPFFRNTLLGDLGYVTLFFGSYELVTLYLQSAKFKVPTKG